VEFTGDLGSGFALEKDDCPLVVTSNRCIPVTDTLNGTVVVFLACEIIQLLSLLFCMVKAVHNFDFWPVINDKHYVIQWWRLVFSTGTLWFAPTAVASFAGLTWLSLLGSTACVWDWDSTKCCMHYRGQSKIVDTRSSTSEIQQHAFRHTATDVAGKFAASIFDV
jgi:hypothetical protein